MYYIQLPSSCLQQNIIIFKRHLHYLGVIETNSDMHLMCGNADVISCSINTETTYVK